MDKLRLSDGRSVLIRKLVSEDREKLLQMYASLLTEALRWVMPPYDETVIDRWLGNLKNMIALVAACNSKIGGHASIYRFPNERTTGLGDLIIYVHQDFQNKGLGTLMLKKLVAVARNQKLHKIVLEVVAENAAAVHLYQKVGFRVEGTAKESYFGEDEKYHDLLIMGLIL